ncbi:major capsid protein [Stenotrophomonas phage BUCT603]|nr:major capsid protein [Stenotrophomonas phage BUCT603]
MSGNTAEQNLKAATDAINETHATLKAYAEEARKRGSNDEALNAKVDEALLRQGELQANVTALQQQIAELEGNGAGGDVQHVSLGAQFVGSDDFKAFAENPGRGRFARTYEASITSATTDADGSAGALVPRERKPGILEIPQRKLTIRDLLAVGSMSGNLLEYVRETGFTNNAAPVAEGAKKPESSLKFDTVTTSPKVIAHWMKASRQILSDAPMLQSFINSRLTYGLKFKEEDQLLNGDGTGQNLEGLLKVASAFVDPTGGKAETAIDRIRAALLQAELAELPSSGIVLNPIDWAEIELMKDTLGRYLIGNPQGTLSPTLWNLPVVTTQAIAKGKFLAGAFKTGAQILDRWQMSVQVATENEDDFVKNMVTILCEERIGFPIYRPEAFVFGDVNAPADGN